MHELSRRKLFGLAAITPLAAMLHPHNGASSAGGADAAVADRERIRRKHFPNVPLLTQDNKKVQFYDEVVKDKIVTLNFFYARCEGICPIVTANLVKVQRLLSDRVGRDIFMVSLTLKPLEDTPAVLKEYAQMHGIKPGWTLLTGKPDDIELLRRSLGFTNLEPALDQDKSQHIGNIRYGNEPMLQWAAMPGMAKPEEIAHSINRDFPPKSS
jgi:protein SCO1/2